MSRTIIQDSDRPDMARFIEHHWGSTKVICCGTVYYPHEHEGLIERRDDRIVGLLTWCLDGDGMQLLTLNATLEGQGIGSSLMLTAIEEGRKRALKRIWLATTNDNLRAIGFYQRLGFRMVEIHIGSIDRAREIKPQIPDVGRGGIPMHDEIVLELRIKPYSDTESA